MFKLNQLLIENANKTKSQGCAKTVFSNFSIKVSVARSQSDRQRTDNIHWHCLFVFRFSKSSTPSHRTARNCPITSSRSYSTHASSSSRRVKTTSTIWARSYKSSSSITVTRSDEPCWARREAPYRKTSMRFSSSTISDRREWRSRMTSSLTIRESPSRRIASRIWCSIQTCFSISMLFFK